MSVLDRFSLSGRTALVTGAGRGIGRSFSLALAEAGADVAVVDLDAENARTVAEEVSRMGRQSLVITADVTQLDQIELMVSQVIDAWGRLDIGVNNAGIANATPAEDISEQEWDAIISVNLKGVFFCCQAEARAMFAAKSGSIINTASISAQTVNRPQTHAHYNATKAGVLQLSRTCATEWAERGIRVNCISPGHTITPMTCRRVEEWGETWLANTPIKRFGYPEDLQGALIYLASDASAYVTGHDLVVDGGYTLW